MKSPLFLGALIFVASLSAQPAKGSVDQPGAPVQDVSFCELVKSTADFAGKTIRIRGIYRYVLEYSEFGPVECCPAKMHGHFDAIINGNPMYPDPRSERLARKLTAQMSATALVVFVGRLDGHVLEVDRVEKIEHLSHPKDKDHEPAWVPPDCELIRAPGE